MVDLGLGALILLVQLVDLVLDEADLLEAAVLLPGADEAPGTVIGARTGVGVAAAQFSHGLTVEGLAQVQVLDGDGAHGRILI